MSGKTGRWLREASASCLVFDLWLGEEVGRPATFVDISAGLEVIIWSPSRFCWASPFPLCNYPCQSLWGSGMGGGGVTISVRRSSKSTNGGGAKEDR